MSTLKELKEKVIQYLHNSSKKKITSVFSSLQDSLTSSSEYTREVSYLLSVFAEQHREYLPDELIEPLKKLLRDPKSSLAVRINISSVLGYYIQQDPYSYHGLLILFTELLGEQPYYSLAEYTGTIYKPVKWFQ
jgi:hypothetical protein